VSWGLWGLHTGYRFDSPEHITVTRHPAEEAKSLAQEVWDQDGPHVLWAALRDAYPSEHVYVARDPAGTIHGVGRGEFETDADGAQFDSDDSYSNYLRISHLYASLKAPPGTGNKIMQDAARHGIDTGHHLMVNGAMPHTTDYYNQLGVEQWSGDRGQDGYWSNDSQHALVAGDSIPGTQVSVRHDQEYYEPVPRAARLPGSARTYGHHTAAVEADVAEDLRRMAAIEFDYLRNNNGSRVHYPKDAEDFDMHIEPWGRYVAPTNTKEHPGELPSGWERGIASFDNPLYIREDGWKKTLSEAHGGLTGRALSEALLAKGHDGIVTHNEYGLGEMVDIRPKPQRRYRTAAQDPQALVQRLRALNHRHILHRSSRPVPDRVLAEHPPLSVREDNERQKLTDYAEGLRRRWDDMEPMTPDEEAAHMAFHGPYARRDPDTMPDRQKAAYYAELQHYGPQTRREHHHLNQMRDWADGHFGNMVNDAQDEVARHRQYLETGQHPTGVSSLEGLDGSHHPDLTGAWASELAGNAASKRLRARQGDYHDALHRVANGGPLHVDDTQPFENIYAFQHLENARNHLRVELQHANLFKVPHIDELSPIEEHADRHARSGLANPRFSHGTGGRSAAARQAYQVNCQRCVLAAEARHRGHNVEARPNYRDEDRPNDPGNDRQFRDHDIAAWFRNPDGTVPKWTDAEDADHPSAMNRSGEPLKLKHFGEQQWDHMHEQIKSWGPGARGAVVMSTPTLTGDSYTRHIIHAVVDDKGKVNYIDPQTGNNDASHHRESIGYNLHPENQTKRLWLDKRPLDEEDRVALHNRNMSPLRYMRLDDKQLSPEVAQHVVDRGTAGGRAIIPPHTN
jgi:hypothetical protein